MPSPEETKIRQQLCFISFLKISAVGIFYLIMALLSWQLSTNNPWWHLVTLTFLVLLFNKLMDLEANRKIKQLIDDGVDF